MKNPFNRKNNLSEDVDDLELIYDLYFDKLYRFFYYKMLSKEKAEDMTSETFLEYVKSLKDGKKVENKQAYLFGIARNVLYKELKYKYTEVSLSYFDDNFFEYTEDFLEEIDSKETVEDIALIFIDNLPDKQKDVLKLRLIEKNSLKEICEKLGKDMNYVKVTQKRGIKSIKKLIALGVLENEK